MTSFARTAGQSAARVIRQRILTGELAPGAMLNQNELAQEFGMSRIPIRDALRSLAAEGLVQLRAHATASVTPLSLDDLEELYELRLSLEPHLCYISAPHLTVDDLGELREKLEAMERTSDLDRWLELNNAFHEILYRRSNRPRTIEIINRIREATLRYVRIYQQFSPEVSGEGHRSIYDAAVAGHGRRLESLVAAHLSDGYETMIKLVAQSQTQHSEATTGD
jgi:DNA-binding GntR family transcriptional regulator